MIPAWVTWRLGVKMAPFLAIFGAVAALIITRGTLVHCRADAVSYGQKVFLETQKAYTLAAMNREAVLKNQLAISERNSDEYQNDLAARVVSYNSLWKAYNTRHGSAASLPAVPDIAKGFSEASCRDGFLCIPAETAFALMKAADDNTGQLVKIQNWAADQTKLPVDIISYPPAIQKEK